MTTKITVSSNEEVQWPNRCARCGTKENLVAAGATIGRVTSVRPNLAGGLSVKGELLSLGYPVCKEHSKGLGWANLMTRKTMGLSLMRGVLYVFGPLSIFLFASMALLYLLPGPKSSAKELPVEFLVIYALFGLGFVALIAAFRKLPLRLVSKGEESVTIKFKNDAYASEFGRLNKDIVTLN